MYGGIPSFLLSASQIKAAARYERQKAEDVLLNAVPWDPKIKWHKELCFDAKSYNAWLKQYLLFPDLKAVMPKTRGADPRESAHHADLDGNLLYVHRTFPGKTRLLTLYGKNQGSVWFTGPVTFPVLLRRLPNRNRIEFRDENVWMSLTPMEIFTQRGGTRRAKGHVVVAGLGLGYQLIQVCSRRQVDKVTLVEINKDLVDWLLPAIRPHLNGVKVNVRIGDARKIVPKIQADVALIDIDAGYGGNEFPRCPKIGYVWVWGSQYAE